ncbi:MAG: hypothetical protein Kow0042_29110 [Calditrichia bacterium]
MKRYYRFFVFFLIPLLLFSCRPLKLSAVRVEKPIQIEGKTNDWPQAQPVVLADSGLTVRAAHDGTHLYLAITSEPVESRRAYLRSGITAWVDVNGGKSKQVEIRFPASRLVQTNRIRGGFWQSLTAEEKKRASEKLEKQAKGVLVINRMNNRCRIFPAGELEEFQAASTRSRESRIIEMKIPMQFYAHFLTLELPLEQQTVGIGITTDQMTAERFPQPPMRGIVPGRRGTGGFPGSDFQEERKEIWLEVHLEK